jgi:cystathionine beta-lyase/cystathionine gamma-synthase
MKKETFDPANPTHRLIRLYIGLEEPDFLIKDLSNSFNGI